MAKIAELDNIRITYRTLGGLGKSFLKECTVDDSFTRFLRKYSQYFSKLLYGTYNMGMFVEMLTNKKPTDTFEGNKTELEMELFSIISDIKQCNWADQNFVAEVYINAEQTRNSFIHVDRGTCRCEA